MDVLTKAPFNLDPAALSWVTSTLAGMSLDDRLRHLFVLRSGTDPLGFAAIKAFRPGGMTAGFERGALMERENIADLMATAAVPPLVSCDLEGSRMSLPFGVEVPNPLGLAALDDLEATAEISRIMAEEANACGINWSFTPLLDINAAFRSAIVATRGFGSSVDVIARHALKQIEVFQAHGIAATVKHWPGEGYDDRDQHLVTTINPLSLADWEESFGRLYRAAIKAGVYSVMSAHIALPEFIRSLDPDAGLEAFRPASINRHLNITLLRERLGFNGLIVSDATSMAGLGAWSRRDQAIVDVVASGCDVILFSDNPDADLAHLHQGITDGRLDPARVDDAVLRILALKAALGLHKGRSLSAAPDMAKNQLATDAITRRIPTLVKDVQNLLPLNPDTHRRILVITPGIVFPFINHPLPFIVPDLLREKGFEVTVHTPETDVTADRFDLVLYLFGDETLLTRGRIFLDWLSLTGHFGKAMQRYWHDIPTAMISFGYPYMLYDAPRVPTYINAYSTAESMQVAVVDCLLGNHAWNRNNPVDPFCGLEDARY